MALTTPGGCGFPLASRQVTGREVSSSDRPTRGREHVEGLSPPRGTWI